MLHYTLISVGNNETIQQSFAIMNFFALLIWYFMLIIFLCMCYIGIIVLFPFIRELLLLIYKKYKQSQELKGDEK
jgi:hypothetical protein